MNARILFDGPDGKISLGCSGLSATEIRRIVASAIEARKGRDAKRLDGDSHDSASDAQNNSSE